MMSLSRHSDAYHIRWASTSPTPPRNYLPDKKWEKMPLRVFNDYGKIYACISADVKAELPQVRAAVAWSKRL